MSWTHKIHVDTSLFLSFAIIKLYVCYRVKLYKKLYTQTYMVTVKRNVSKNKDAVLNHTCMKLAKAELLL